MRTKILRFCGLVAAAAVAVAFAVSCAGGAPAGGFMAPGVAPPPPLPEPPPGAETLLLENGGYAIFRFDLPAGATWGDFSHISAEYMVDEVNVMRSLRHVRLMGNYRDYHFQEVEALVIGDVTVRPAMLAINFGDDQINAYGTGTYNGPFIMDAVGGGGWEAMGAVANEWFTVEYDTTGGARAHGQFAGNRANAIPAAGDTGPFFFGLGLSGDSGQSMGVYQFIRNVTLHHRTNPALSVVSTGSGFDVDVMAGFFPVQSRRSGFRAADAE